MRITIEGWNEPCLIGRNEYSQFTLKINGKDVHFQIEDAWYENKPARGWNLPDTYYKVVAERISQLKVKTKEEIAAEESVAKAKEALKAAENALKIVKEKK